MFKRNETSNYDEIRMRNISEPDIVNKIPFEQDSIVSLSKDHQE